MAAMAAIFLFPIGMILGIFHLHINLLLHCKFQLHSACGLRDVQNRFSIWRLRHLGFQINRISFRSRSHPVATEQVPKVWEEMSKIDFQDSCCGGHLGFSMGSLILAILCLPDAPHQVSTQLYHSL